MSKVDLSRLIKSWPSPFIPRTEVLRFTGGIITPAFLANLDSQGLGPPGRFRCGGKIVYPVDSLVKWLEERSKADE